MKKTITIIAISTVILLSMMVFSPVSSVKAVGGIPIIIIIPPPTTTQPAPTTQPATPDYKPGEYYYFDPGNLTDDWSDYYSNSEWY